MKNNSVWFLAACVLAGAGIAAALAQSDDGPPQGGGRRHRHPPLPIVMALDANHDGVIDANEIANAPAALKTLDKNGDGRLTKNEYLPLRPDGSVALPPPGPDGQTPPMPLIIKALDVNGDGVIDASEIANASAELKTLDKNGDGELTRDEYLGKRPRMRPPPDDGNGPPDGQNGGGPPGQDGGVQPPPQ